MWRIICYWARFRGMMLSIRSLSGFNLHLYIFRTLKLTPSKIHFGKGVVIFYHSRIEAITSYCNVKFAPLIVIEDNVTIQQNLHLTCANRVFIGKNTAIAANVTITDIHHPYLNINMPIEQQNIQVGSVYIGDDCKIYNNVVVLPNVKIGKHVTVGANSVVNMDLPDFCVAVGNPVRIIKRYDFFVQSWRKTNPQGEFID